MTGNDQRPLDEAAAGSVRQIIGSAAEITTRKRAEDVLAIDVLAESEQRQRLLSDMMLHGVVHQDAYGNIIAMNPAAERILGKRRDQLLGSTSEREQHHTIREDGTEFPGNEHPSMVALATGQPQRDVIMGVFNPQTQALCWIRIDAVPVIRPGEDQVAEVFAVFEDITARKQAEAALLDAQRQKDLFIATLAHELRNPLAPIGNATRLLAPLAAGNPQAAWAHQVIERQVALMSRLLDDLLDVSRIGRGKVDLQRQRVTVDSIIAQGVEIAQPLIDAAGHQLTVNLPPQPIMVDGDPIRLAQVCANVLNNAAKYTPAGGRIAVRVELEGDRVAIFMKDNGIGLLPDHYARVFDVFGQVDTAVARSQGGLGIGLSLARSLVEVHGGSIDVHSDGPNQGSEFVIRLPCVVIADNNPSASASTDTRTGSATSATAPSAAAADTDALVGRRVLVVDDNVDGAESFAMLLALDGHRVDLAHDGQAAWVQVQANPPEVLMLDLGLPKMNGTDLCRAIRAQPWGQAMVIVAVTGWGQDVDRQRSVDAGFDLHLVKPVDYATLQAAMRLRPSLP